MNTTTNTTMKVAKTAKSEAQYAKPVKEGDGSTTKKIDIEVPYTDYQNEHKIPYSAKYMGVENTWEEFGISDDIQTIEEYVGDLVNKGELENSIKTVEKKLKSIEKMANIDGMESGAQRLIKLATFIQYLQTLERKTNERHR